MNLISRRDAGTNPLVPISTITPPFTCLLYTSVMLPDGSGYDVCRHLKGFRLYQNIPVIILTALNDKQSMLEGLKAGADEFLTKPVDSHELVLRVKNLLKMKTIANDLDERYRQLHNELAIATELQKSFLPQKVPCLLYTSETRLLL